MRRLNIAIDGPAGAGKSTVARKVAKELSMVYIDTGAMYRALTWLAFEKKINVDEEESLFHLLKESDIRFQNEGEAILVKMNGEDVTEELRKTDITNFVSYTAKHPPIRREMVRKQQLLAAEGGIVMDGRDIGTAVLPNAEVKIFLTASVEERAKRRHEEQLSKNMVSDFEQVKKEMAERDKIDTERDTDPLKKAEDAIEMDTTSLTVDDVVSRICQVAKERDDTFE